MAVNINLDGATDQILDIRSAGSAEKMIGSLSSLTTTAKGSVVEAINELNSGKANGAGITFFVENGIMRANYTS